MRLAELLVRRRDLLFPRFVELTWATDPGGAAFAKREADPFQNPVGATVTGALREIYDGLAAGLGAADVAAAVERMVRLRAVQGLAPSEAVRFTLLLRQAVLESLAASEAREDKEGKEGREGREGREGEAAALSELEVVERELLLLAVDRYVACREKLFDGRLKSELARVGAILRRVPGMSGPADPADPAEAWNGGAP